VAVFQSNVDGPAEAFGICNSTKHQFSSAILACFSLSKQTADNTGEGEVESRADHHAAHSAEKHEDIGLHVRFRSKQTPLSILGRLQTPLSILVVSGRYPGSSR
jgi:hypothetical protein